MDAREKFGEHERRVSNSFFLPLLLLLLQHLQNYIYTYLHLQLLTYNYALFLQVSFFLRRRTDQEKNSCAITVFLNYSLVICISIVELLFPLLT